MSTWVAAKLNYRHLNRQTEDEIEAEFEMEPFMHTLIAGLSQDTPEAAQVRSLLIDHPTFQAAIVSGVEAALNSVDEAVAAQAIKFEADLIGLLTWNQISEIAKLQGIVPNVDDLGAD